MLITRVELLNIKSYRHASVELRPGTTAIRGHNGAGKSTLVEAIGWALFDALPYSQAQFVREGEKWGQVTVTFRSAEDDREYQVVRKAGAGALCGSAFVRALRLGQVFAQRALTLAPLY